VLDLLPWPAGVETGSRALTLESAAFEAVFEGDVAEHRNDLVINAVRELSQEVARKTSLPFAAAVPVRILSAGLSDAMRGVVEVPGPAEDESYWLVVDDAGIFVEAATVWGVLHGLTTLAQLVDDGGRIPHASIDDRPRFGWRGLLLDPARHFLPVADVRRTLDGMARCKLNVLHLHLTDDQGFRFHVPEYPKLASAEAYTDEDLRNIVTHAGARGIRVVPEVDMPGHVTSWLVAYPELGPRQVEATARFGVHPGCLDPTREATYETIGCILDVLVRLFPDPCLHIGGDEVSPRWWSEDPQVEALKAREGLEDVRAVQGYFNRRVGRMVAERERQVVAWDEVLEAGAEADWVIQAWRGATMRDRARNRGHRVVLSAPYYLDLHYPADVHYGFDPAAPQAELVDREDRLTTDSRFAHVAGGIRWTEQWREGAGADAAVGGGAIMGAEACLWGELVNPEVLDLRLWGRLPAVAERFWSAVTMTDAVDMYRRQDAFIDRVLPAVGIDLSTRTRWQTLGIGAPWDALLEMLEPVKWYGRLLGAEALAARLAGSEMPQARPYDLSSRLDGLIDHLPVESRAARQVAQLCTRAEADGGGAREELKCLIGRWQTMAGSAADAPAGLAPLALKLGRLGELIIGRLEKSECASTAALDDLLVPEGEFVLALPPSLHRWLIDA